MLYLLRVQEGIIRLGGYNDVPSTNFDYIEINIYNIYIRIPKPMGTMSDNSCIDRASTESNAHKT